MQLELGKGKVEVATVTDDGKFGLLLRTHPDAHAIGEFVGGSPDNSRPVEFADSDLVVWLGSLAAARVLQDAVNQAVLKMQGIP